MSSSCDILLVLLRLARQLEQIDHGRYTRLSESVMAIGRQVLDILKYKA